MALNAKTTVLNSQGEVRTAESLKVGDQLLGPDSRPRNITKLRRIDAQAVEIIPHRGERIVCDARQLLPLFKPEYVEKPFAYMKDGKQRFKRYYEGYPNYMIIEAEDLVKGSAHKFGRRFLLYQVPIEFQFQETPVAPYFLGLWLGDGHANRPAITTADKPIVDYVYSFAKGMGMKVTINPHPENKSSTYIIVRDFDNESKYYGRQNPLQTALANLGVLANKHIPHAYLVNSREVRLAVLAGLIDSDGSLERNVYHVTQKSHRLALEIAVLASGLGFRAVITKIRKGIKSLNFIGEYYRVSISGRIDSIPVMLPRKRVHEISSKHNRLLKGFLCKQADYITKMVEIEVDGDGQYLLSDCTVMGGVKSYETIDSFERGFHSDRKWNRSCAKLETFVGAKQRLPQRILPQERPLSYWIADNVKLGKKGLLSAERISKLKNLGVDFQYRENLFFNQFNHLLNFREAYPNRWPVHGEQFPEGNLLGSWCKDKRKAYRKGTLAKWQINMLAEIGFPFRIR